MPHIDDRSGEVVIRIVYDGAPEAGKTTNVAQLLSQISVQRRGATASPGTMGERTEFFDWLDFTGGYLDGRRVRCQIVSVPGQRSLESRRERLLATADAIVFVVDSSPARLTEALESWNAAERLLASRAPAALAAPVGMVVQVNKQDQPDALAPPEVLRRLGMEETTPAVSSVASAGTGVMETFVLAARLATNRVRALLLEDATLSDLPRVEAAPDALHEAMLDAERVPEDDALDWSIPPAPPEPEPKAEVVPASAPRPIAVPRPQGGRPTAPASFHGDAGPDTTRPTRPVLPAAERPTRPIPAPVIGTRDAGRYSITSAPVEDDPRPPRPPIPKRASDDETTPVQSPAPPPAEPELEIEPEPEPKPKPAPPRPTRPSSDDEVTPVKSPVPEPLEPAPESTTPTVRPAPPAIEPAPPAIELAPPTFEPIEPAPPTFEPIEPAPPTFEPIEPAPPTFEPAPPAIELAPASFEPEAAPTGLLAFLKRLFSWLFGDQAWNR